jgi:transposase InsO family protein
VFTILYNPYSEERGASIAVQHRPLGHFGVNKVFQSATASGMDATRLREGVTEFIKFCPTCQKMSYVRPVVHSILCISDGTKPMYELCIDTVRSCPKDEEGLIYIVVIIDSFTRNVTLHRCADTTVKAAGTALSDEPSLLHLNVPKVIQTDNGSQYVNALISTLTKLFNVKHNLSISYFSQENGICERVNREVNRHLQMLTVGQNKTTKWSFYLPLVLRIINASEHMVTGYSPSQLMFEDSVNHRRGLFPTITEDLIIPTTNIDE